MTAMDSQAQISSPSRQLPVASATGTLMTEAIVAPATMPAVDKAETATTWRGK